MQVSDRSVSVLLHVAVFVAPFPRPLGKKEKNAPKKKRTLCRTDSSEVAKQENEMERKAEVKVKSDKTVPDCLHVCWVFFDKNPSLYIAKTENKKKTKKQ